MRGRDINPVEGLVARQDIDDAHQGAVLASAFTANLGSLAMTYANMVQALAQCPLPTNGEEGDDGPVLFREMTKQDNEVLALVKRAIASNTEALSWVTASLARPLLGAQGSA